MSLYHGPELLSTQKEEQRTLLPKQLRLIPSAYENPLFSSTYESKGMVKCSEKLKVKAPPVATTTDEAIDNQRGLYPHRHQQLELWDRTVERSSTTMEARKIRGLEIAIQQEIIREGNVWIVPSQTSSKKYTVNLFLQTCTCADFDSHRVKCKHIYAAEAMLAKESGLQLPVPEKRVRPTYRQEWHEYNLAQTNEKAKLQELLFELCRNIEEPSQHMGRPRVPIADRIFACCFKIYSRLSGRRFMSDLREAKQRGYLQVMPHYNSIFRYLEGKDLTDYLKQLISESSLPLTTVEVDFAVDSSGFSTGVYQKWSEAKWGSARTLYGEKQPNEINRQDWLKVHVMCGVKTNIVTSVVITDAHAGDYPQFAPLVNQTSRNFVMNQVSADKAYSGSTNLQLVLIKGAQPFIDFKLNATANSKDKRQTQVWKRMFHFYSYNKDYFMQQYHKRSNVETTFSMIKAKFGERLRSKTETAQINEVLCKILCHNICCLIQSIYELGVEPAFRTDSI